MFIVCPSCSGPYRIAADQISALVQVACPHCEYRIILDFEAANDPALREPGMQFAQGYENAEAYFSVYSHVGKNPGVQPFSAPGVAPGQVPQAAEVKATGTSPQSPLVDAKPAEVKPAEVKPAASSPSAALGTPSTGLLSPSGMAAASSSRAAKTVMHTPSKKPVPLDPTSEPLAPRPKAPSGPSMRAGAHTEQVNEAKPVEAVAAAEPASNRQPPHTPPATNVVSSGPTPVEPVATKPEDPAAQSHSQLKPEGDKKPAETKPVEATPAKPTDNSIKPAETSNSKFILIGIVLVIALVLLFVFVINKP